MPSVLLARLVISKDGICDRRLGIYISCIFLFRLIDIL